MAQITGRFISYCLQRTVTFSIVIPSMTCPEWMSVDLPEKRSMINMKNVTIPASLSHRHPSPFPVLYLLHGTANDEQTWLRYTNIERYAEERNIAVVTLSGENKAYLNRINHDLFFDFLNEELPDFVTANFPVSDKPADTYIAGLSMGGYGTLLHALSHSERYHAFGAFSAGIKRREETPEKSDISTAAVDLFALAREKVPLGIPKGYMACGEKDPVFQLNQEYRDLLISLGADITWEQLPDYGHEWDFWNIQVRKFLDWLPREDDYAHHGVRQI